MLREFTAVELPDELSGLTDLVVEDVTLDGLNDLVMVRSGSLEVWSRSAAGANDWSLTMADPDDDSAWNRVLVADIDRDFDPAASNLESPHLLEDRDGDRRMVSDPAGQPRWFDTDLDLIAWSDSVLAIYRNELSESGERRLSLVSRYSLEGINDVAAADIDADGDLDIVVAATDAVHVLVNTNGTVFEQRQLSDVGLSDLTVGDVDRNIATDLVGTSLDGGVGLLQNMFHSRFRWLPGMEVFGDGSPGDRVSIADVDGNLSWDVVTSGPAGLRVIRTKTTAPGVMSGLATGTISKSPVTDFTLADLDNDGHQDIAALTQTGIVLYRGLSDGTFAELDIATPDAAGTSIAANDLDHDGDLDLLVIDTDGQLRLMDNEGGNSNHWIDIVVRGKEDDPQFRSRRVNMHGVGAVLEVMAGPLWQAHVVDSPVMHIGLGQADRLDAIRIVWTDGVPQDVVTDKLLRPRIGILAPQILKGSCPYIYTWTGDGFEFFSDCLWSAPIGLVQATGDLAPTREWEHLLISGDRLVPRDGEYVLQVTEELWEIAYFDQIELFAIDHPSEVQIFTNEKVGPPSLAAHRIHTVRHPRRPRSVVDGRGTDLLPGLSGKDGDYVQAFTTRRVQGLTDEWTMEFDLGDIDDVSDVRLFLTGWIFPTDTSLNYHIRQNPDLHPPAPPSIEVPDGDGWKTARPFIGFPSGKTKAMVIDLTGIVGPDNTRFRLRSSMELYFDDAFFTIDETDEPTTSHVCALVNADLHYRGYSRRTYAPETVFRQGNAPEGYDYNRVTTDPRWSPLFGRFTRYGLVGDLLQDADDRLAVMGPGDEMTVRFSVPAAPIPVGWTRDFVLRNVGWDKDADLNTVYGQSSEPLPFRA